MNNINQRKIPNPPQSENFSGKKFESEDIYIKNDNYYDYIHKENY